MEIIFILIGLAVLAFIIKQLFSKKFWLRVKDYIVEKTVKTVGGFILGLVVFVLFIIFILSLNK